MKQTTRKKLVRQRKKTASIDLELCSRFQSGDFTAFPELAKNYTKLIKNVAEKYESRNLPLDELMLHAKIGLLKAAHRFDESKMVSFRLYAIWWMRQVILKALHEQARIAEVPEMLILQLNNLMHSFTRREQLLLDESAETVQTEQPKLKPILQLKRPRRKAS